MAASATNTSREIGAVTGVAILGSLMFSRINASLTTQMNQLHVPAVYRGLVFNAIETGNFSVPPGLSGQLQKLLTELTGVAYTAFHNGLRTVLYLSAGLALFAGLLALITLRSQPVDSVS
jgi:hypothetical protein